MSLIRLLAAIAILTFVGSIATPTLAHPDHDEEAAPAEEAAAEETGDGEGEEEKKKDDEKAYADVIEDHEAIEGLFTLYRNPKDNAVLLSILPEQFETEYLCNIQREAGDGRYFDSGTMAGSFPFVFERVGKKVRFVHKNVYYRADEDAPIAGAVARGLSNSLVGSAEVLSAPDPDTGAILVKPDSFFLQDMVGVQQSLSNRKLDHSYDSGESYFASLKSFPKNTEIETVAHFSSKKSRATNMRIPDGKSFEHRYRFSLIEIPDSDYVPRFADDRVGYFLTMFQDYTQLTKETPYTWYIERWNLKKKKPKSRVSEPVEPITFWVDNATPHEYRDAVRDGALLWNDAFEKAGFKNAIVVKQMPDDADWDPSDIRYNVIRWIVMPGGGYAVGPSVANPYTGEIYGADIRISADFIRYFYRSYEEYIQPLSELAKLEDLDAHRHHGHPSDACRYSTGKAFEAAFGVDLMHARQYVDPNSKKFKNFVREGLMDLVAHEVGHTLGFRHNFRASTIHTTSEVHDRRITDKEGVSGSVMDYNPVNVAPTGQKQGAYWCAGLGTYDYWVVEYGYTPFGAKKPQDEMEELEAIASRGTEAKLTYATDEDAFGGSYQGIDPTVNMWDLGDDQITFYEERVQLADELIANLEKTFEKPGHRYQKLRLAFGRALFQYGRAGATVAKQLGGLYHRRDHIGDPNGRAPFAPVPAKEQRRALNFLKEHLFAADAFQFSPSLVNKLAPERLYDFDWSIYYAPRVDFPIHSAVLSAQSAAMNRLYHPITLHRMVDYGLHTNGGEIVTMFDMFDEVTDAVWSEATSGSATNGFRRNLQRAHLKRMIDLVVSPRGAPYYSPSSGQDPAGHLKPPEDARSCARANLLALSSTLEGALASSSLAAETRAHFDESHARILAALEAGVERDL